MQVEQHSQKVKELSVELAKRLKIDKKEIELIRKASGLHDIGKINIPQEILQKPGALTKKEYNIIKLHSLIGFEMVKNISEYEELALIVKHHHERYDGKGYPNCLQQTQIPLGSRIICIADAYVAMISERPYRRTFTQSQAIDELIKHKNTQFDPQLVDVFVEMVKDGLSEPPLATAHG